METELKELLEKERKNYFMVRDRLISPLTNFVLKFDESKIYFGANESEIERTIMSAIKSNNIDVLLFTFRQMLEHNK